MRPSCQTAARVLPDSRRLVLCALAIVGACWVPLAHAADGPAISLKRSPVPKQPQKFVVIGLANDELAALENANFSAKQWQEIFAVYVNASGASKLPPLFGEYSVDGNLLVFSPRFALRPGATYRAVFRSRSDAKPIKRTFSIPAAPPTDRTTVTHVFPSRDVLPENQLKFYLHFSAPMSRGEAYDNIRLLHKSGEAVELPFLELEQELWDETGARFTLFFDPGRIKRGLKPREEVGPALEEGKSYALVIDKHWRDANGQPLSQEFRKEFKVAAPDDTQPNPKKWRMTAPAAETTQPLTAVFEEPLDRAMLQRLLVLNAAQQVVAGEVTVDDEETRWRFQPKQPWPSGSYNLQVKTTLEDLAGNSIGRPFEVDVFRTVEKQAVAPTISLSFEVK